MDSNRLIHTSNSHGTNMEMASIAEEGSAVIDEDYDVNEVVQAEN